ncbi:MAG: DUF4054 domain-containing protein [Octadecabacter sp.]|nr:DUF4054 domain-containing protein [Octadecabacter sp.]
MSDPATLLPVIAPEFAGVDATDAIAVAEIQVAPGLCGDKRPLLIAYLTAHILSIGARAGGAAGGVSSLKEGQLGITYGGAGEAGGSLGATSYGAEYDRMSRACAFSVRTRVTHV